MHALLAPIWIWIGEKEKTPISTETYRINDEIRVKQVRLIGSAGQNYGVVTIQEASRIAYDEELDLVEVAPNADPPVCRVMNYGKFIYEHEKKEREARKAQTKIEVKEIRLRPKTNPHHRFFKVRDARRWLEAGMKVKVRIRFRGREITYPEIALKDLKEVAEELKDLAFVEQEPGREGRSLLMVLAPLKSKIKKPAGPKKDVDLGITEGLIPMDITTVIGEGEVFTDEDDLDDDDIDDDEDDIDDDDDDIDEDDDDEDDDDGEEPKAK